MKQPAVFLDRDGVLVKEVFYKKSGEWEAPWCAEDVRLTDGATQALKLLSSCGYLLILISNQGAYAKGKVQLRDLWLAHERFLNLLSMDAVFLDDFYYSYSHPDGVEPFFSGISLERKPSAMNIIIAAAKHNIDLTRSWFIGDRETDILCGRNADLRTILIRNRRNNATNVFNAICLDNISCAAQYISKNA